MINQQKCFKKYYIKSINIRIYIAVIDIILNSSGHIKFHRSKVTKFLIVKRGDNNPIFSGSPFSVFAFFFIWVELYFPNSVFLKQIQGQMKICLHGQIYWNRILKLCFYIVLNDLPKLISAVDFLKKSHCCRRYQQQKLTGYILISTRWIKFLNLAKMNPTPKMCFTSCPGQILNAQICSKNPL